MKKRFLLPALLAGLAAAPAALSHLENTAFYQSYRQSLFALLGANFGPMGSMVKGEIPWDDATFAAFAEDLAKVASLDAMRGFPPGSEGGRTRAKPEIWDDLGDFESKMNDLQRESAALAALAQEGGDRKALVKQFHKTGGTCKACHDEYKSKDYL